jgi:hypothetical protein
MGIDRMVAQRSISVRRASPTRAAHRKQGNL